MAIPLVVLLTIVIGSTFGCRQRDYGNGGTVCVCDKLYCDTYNKITPLSSGKYEMYTSSLAGDRFTRSSGVFHDNASNANATLMITPEIKLQKIFGFGGAFTDSAGINILSLSNETGLKLMEAYFAETGIEYNMGRIPIGGTDFSTRYYTYDDVQNDVGLNFFFLQFEDFHYKIPLINLAKKLSKKEMKLFGSAWTAPAWMKTNYQLTAVNLLNESMYDAWANYHIKFLDAYAAQGIHLWGLTTGNEPADGFMPFELQFNLMGWHPVMQAHWIACSLGPKVRTNPNYKHVKIMIVDDQRIYFPWNPRTIYSNEIAKSYIDGSAVHYYVDKTVPAEVLSITHNEFPDKFILATEACEGNLAQRAVILGSWERAESYLHSIFDDLNNWVTGWVDWNIALNTEGGPKYKEYFVDAPIIVNISSDEFYKQPTYFAIGHFSKFVPADSIRVESHCLGANLMSVVFERPDGGIVAQVFNPSDSDKIITISEGNSSNMEVEVTIKKRSMNSILYWK